MTPEQRERLLAETRETATRLNKLNSFMATDAFPKLPREDKDLLYSQQRVMSEYVQILGKRLERAGQQFTHSEPQ
jgi:hypothetical protein